MFKTPPSETWLKKASELDKWYEESNYDGVYFSVDPSRVVSIEQLLTEVVDALKKFNPEKMKPFNGKVL